MATSTSVRARFSPPEQSSNFDVDNKSSSSEPKTTVSGPNDDGRSDSGVSSDSFKAKELYGLGQKAPNFNERVQRWLKIVFASTGQGPAWRKSYKVAASSLTMLFPGLLSFYFGIPFPGVMICLVVVTSLMADTFSPGGFWELADRFQAISCVLTAIDLTLRTNCPTPQLNWLIAAIYFGGSAWLLERSRDALTPPEWIRAHCQFHYFHCVWGALMAFHWHSHGLVPYDAGHYFLYMFSDSLSSATP